MLRGVAIVLSRVRQAGIVSEDLLQFPIHLIGVGGIGSPTAFVLGQMGCRNLRLSDPDVVSEENFAYQLYPIQALGRPKVEVLREVIEEFCGFSPMVEQRRVTADDPLQGVVILAVDTLEARQDIWRAVRGNAAIRLFIDARMGGELGEVLALDPVCQHDLEFYERLLAQRPADVPCTAQSISYNVWTIAGLVGSLIRGYAVGDPLPVEIRVDLRTRTLLTWHRERNVANSQ